MDKPVTDAAGAPAAASSTAQVPRKSRFQTGPKDVRPPLRTPLPGADRISALDRMDGELEKRVLAAATSSAPEQHAAPPGGPTGPPPPASAAAEVAAARVRQLERLLRTQEVELRRQEREISKLQAEKLQLQRDNRELHHFLADYGMRWVGDGAGDSAAAQAPGGSGTEGVATEGAAAAKEHTAQAVSSPAANEAAGSPLKEAGGSPLPGPPDMAAVRRAVEELNAMADGPAEVVRRADGAHALKKGEPTLCLTFWRNGLQVQDGELRPYGRPQCASFLRDLLDGFFPYELKFAFPDGVAFSVVDRTHVAEHEPQHTWGQGRRLDSRGGGLSNGLGGGPGSGLGLRGGLGGGARLLGVDPSRMLCLPSGASDGGGGGTGLFDSLTLSSSPAAAETTAPSPAAEAPRTILPAAPEAAANGDECRLQIKDQDGSVACVFTLPATATVAQVHEQLLARGVVDAELPYELRTAFPARVLRDVAETLSAAKLTPSATLCVRTRGLLG